MRRTGLIVAAILFYAAPIGAGATAAGPPTLAMLVFTGMFFLWTVLMRTPEAGPLGYVRSGQPALLAAHVAVQLALAALCVGLGTALRALGQIEVAWPLAGWIVLGLSATLLARLAWPPGLADEMEAFLDETVEALESMNREAEDQRTASETAVKDAAAATPAERIARDRTLAALDALPEDADLGAVTEGIRHALQEMRPGLLTEMLFERAQTPRDRLALACVVTDPEVAGTFPGGQDSADAFEIFVAAADAAALKVWVEGGLALIEEPDPFWREMPRPDRLTEIATQIERDHEALAEDLVTLANRLEDIWEEDARAADDAAQADALADTDRDG
jgi:hypothetical protein